MEDGLEFCHRVQPKAKYITIYLVNRSYGGPEEGGWWYDTGDPVFTIRVNGRNRLHYRRIAERFCRLYNRGRRDLSSILCEGVYRWGESNKPGKPYPSVPPQYE